MAIVGPGSVQDSQIEVRPSLEGASEYEFVTILNPLSDDFAIRVAQDLPVNMPFEIRKDMSGKTRPITNNEQDARQIYGLDLKNPDFTARKHITNDMIIQAGQTINLKGDQAQVAVRQLVNEIAQREGKQRLLADPTVRKEIEDRIIKARGSIQDLMENRLQSPRTQINEAIRQSNEVPDEEAFPDLKEDPSPGTGATFTPGDSQSQPKRVGRPKKADS